MVVASEGSTLTGCAVSSSMFPIQLLGHRLPNCGSRTRCITQNISMVSLKIKMSNLRPFYKMLFYSQKILVMLFCLSCRIVTFVVVPSMQPLTLFVKRLVKIQSSDSVGCCSSNTIDLYLEVLGSDLGRAIPIMTGVFASWARCRISSLP